MYTKQDKFAPVAGQADSGNCFQCCIAGVMGLPVGTVPHVLGHSTDPDENFRFLNAWLRDVHEAFLVQYTYEAYREHLLNTKFFAFLDGLRIIVSGKSPRGEHEHAVIGVVDSSDPKGFRYVFDPHPDNEYIVKPTLIEFIVTNYRTNMNYDEIPPCQKPGAI